jgi:hypothetical protein
MPRLTTHEVVELLRSVLLRLKRSRGPNDFIEAKDMALPEVVVAVVEAVADLLQTLAELTSTPSQKLRHLKSVKDTKRRDCTSSATRRGTVFSNASS